MDTEWEHRTGLGRKGFSLVEMMIVMGVILLIFAMATIGFNAILQSSNMEQSGRMVVDEIQLARQTAIARNQDIEVRFFKEPRPETGSSNAVFWRMQTGIRSQATNSTNTVFEPLRGATKLSRGIALSDNAALSSILGAGTNASLVIRPSGMVEPKTGLSLSSSWFITLVPERKLGAGITDLTDFITVQIDPITSRPTVYRP